MNQKIINFDREQLKEQLDIIYYTYNKKEYIHPDPLEFLYNYPDLKDREITALIASSLAYGRVEQILKHVLLVFEIIKDNLHSFAQNISCDAVKYPSPYNYLMQNNDADIADNFINFKYRFTSGEHIASFLIGIKYIIKEYGSLKNLFFSSIKNSDQTIIPALSIFVKKITLKGNCGNLAPNPEKGSACKRNNLFLRWMIRKDNVDPGGWEEIPSSMLVVPLDTHMHHAGKILGFTNRKQADMRTALEITEGFKEICPNDPVRYDFSLTRFGIHPDMDFNELKTMIENKKKQQTKRRKLL